MEIILESIHVRCPECTKLYSVDPGTVHTEKPQFECVQCKSRFYFIFPTPEGQPEARSYLIGQGPREATPLFLVPQDFTAQDDRRTFACPKCDHRNSLGANECKACGLVFDKARAAFFKPKEEVVASKELLGMWARVLEGWAIQSVHETFVQFALGQSNLPFASQQYRRILDANPADEIAQKMRDKIIQLATMTSVPQKRDPPTRRRFTLPFVVLAVGVVFVGTGLSMEQLRSIVPIGAVFCTIGFAIFFLSRHEN